MEAGALTYHQIEEARALAYAVRGAQKRRRGRMFKGRYYGSMMSDPDVQGRADLNGWRVTGSGCFSKVLEKEGVPYAIKVSGSMGFGLTDCGYTAIDDPDMNDCWPVFAKHCMDNPHKNLPIIMHMEYISKTICFAIMDRLVPLSGDLASWRASEQHSRWRAVLDGIRYPNSDESFLWPIKELGENGGFRVDLHEANVMLRYHGPDDEEPDLVLNDPFSYQETSPCYNTQ